MKKYIPWVIGGVCILVLVAAVILIAPRIRNQQAPEPVEQFGYAVEGQPIHLQNG